nr:putative reverse transcriptase domain-containing protein [Tanacetum cinerariifolium]
MNHMVLCSIQKSPSYNLPPTNLSKLLINLRVLSILSMAWIIVVALSLSPFLQIVCGKYCILILFRQSSRALRTSLSVPIRFSSLQIGPIRIWLSKVEPLLVAFDSQLKIYHTSLNDDASCKHPKRDVKSEAFLNGPFKIISKEGTVAYHLELPEQLSKVHSTFHVSKLKKCLADEPLAIPLDEIQVNDKLHFIKEPVEIMDREVMHLKKSFIMIIKVCWNSSRGLEFTWEREDQIQKKYPHLFPNFAPVADATSLKKTQKGQNQIKTGQKGEAWRSREKSEAVTVDKGRKTEQNTKRRAGNANTCKLYRKKKERRGTFKF